MPSPAQSTPPAWIVEQPRTQPGSPVLPHLLARETTTPARWEWWQWPHLLSLDAPLVAVVWQWWWSEKHGVLLPWTHRLILALAVWMIYLADRLSDAAFPRHGGLHTDRHVFSVVYRPLAIFLLGAAVLSLAVLTPLVLPWRLFAEGLALLAMVGIYYWMIHHASRLARPWLPKEAVVGSMFAVGTAFFVVCEGPGFGWGWLIDVVLFGGLCFVNCGLITCWEQSPCDLEDPASLLRAFPRLAAALPKIALGIAAASLASVPCARDAGNLPVAVSAAALWSLNRYHARLSARALRVLADFVLFSPLLAGLWWWLAR